MPTKRPAFTGPTSGGVGSERPNASVAGHGTPGLIVLPSGARSACARMSLLFGTSTWRREFCPLTLCFSADCEATAGVDSWADTTPLHTSNAAAIEQI